MSRFYAKTSSRMQRDFGQCGQTAAARVLDQIRKEIFQIDAIYGSGTSSHMLSAACSDLLDVSSFWLGPIVVKGQICLFLTGETMELDLYFLQLILHLGMMWWQSIWDVDPVDLQENLCFQWDLWIDWGAKVLCSGGLQPALQFCSPAAYFPQIEKVKALRQDEIAGKSACTSQLLWVKSLLCWMNLYTYERSLLYSPFWEAFAGWMLWEEEGRGRAREVSSSFFRCMSTSFFRCYLWIKAVCFLFDFTELLKPKEVIYGFFSCVLSHKTANDYLLDCSLCYRSWFDVP